MSDSTPKKYPLTTKEVADMLGIEHNGQDLPLGSFSAKGKPPILDLPTAQTEHGSHADAHQVSPAEHAQNGAGESHADEKPSEPALIKLGKAALPYALIFT